MVKIYFTLIRDFIRMIIPDSYLELARAWGIRDPTLGLIIAFGTSWLLVSAIVWLGLTLSFGKLKQNDNSIKRAFIVIAGAIGGFATYTAAEFMVYVLSDLIYSLTIIISGIVLIAIGKAVWAGVPAAGATTYEAKKLEEAARKEYEEAKYKRIFTLKKMIDDLVYLSEATEKILDEITNYLNKLNLEEEEKKYYTEKLNKLKERIENAKSKKEPVSMFATLDAAVDILEEVLEIKEFEENKLKKKTEDLVNKIKKVTKILKKEEQNQKSK